MVKIDRTLRGILENLANGIFPLQPWIEDKDTRVPPPTDDHGKRPPWRKPDASLTPNDLGAIDFFIELISDPEAELRLLERWEAIEREPLKYFHLQAPGEASAWRAARGLDPKTQFGILESENNLLDVDEHPIVRAHFYEQFWPLLRDVVRQRRPKSEADWILLARLLHQDACPEWPTGQPLRSSLLIYQFGRDLLHAMMNMDNPVKPPWRQALLIELGEHRRVGNEWTRIDADDTVQELRKALEPAPAEAAALDRGREVRDVPPVGTPPQKPYRGRRSPLVEEGQ